jgi:TonB-dependent Receptor Plug Domain/AMP-binding enzyme C-terminal domain
MPPCHRQYCDAPNGPRRRRLAQLAKRFMVTLCAAWLPAVASADGAATAADPGASAAIEEIVVTAQRREENLQKTSVPIDVLSGNELRNANVLNMTDLTAAVPGLQIGEGAGPVQIYIRGVGDFGSTPINNPAVATNIDGVYVARTQALQGNFFDVARVEVLEGPQGTLYGRNASGGLPMAFVTLKPGAQATLTELQTYAARTVPERAAVPVRIEVLPELPLTAVGKIAKPLLRVRAINYVLNQALGEEGLSEVHATARLSPELGIIVDLRGPAMLRENAMALAGQYPISPAWEGAFG